MKEYVIYGYDIKNKVMFYKVTFSNKQVCFDTFNSLINDEYFETHSVLYRVYEINHVIDNTSFLTIGITNRDITFEAYKN